MKQPSCLVGGGVQPSCRLCGNAVEDFFVKTVLRKYSVHYYQCQTCRCLQTEEPYWLAEAYKYTLHPVDVTSARRLLECRRRTYLTAWAFGISNHVPILDWGGGDGLLVRMLRDLGLDAYVYDKYAENKYAIGFESTGDAKYGMITAFEVLEHLPSPGQELAEMLKGEPDMVLVSTEQYADQGPEWDYLAPETGQHVFFWSDQGMRWVAERFRYRVQVGKKWTVFWKNRSTRGYLRLRLALSQKTHFLQGLLLHAASKTSRTAADKRLIRQRIERGELS